MRPCADHFVNLPKVTYEETPQVTKEENDEMGVPQGLIARLPRLGEGPGTCLQLGSEPANKPEPSPAAGDRAFDERGSNR
eukprot:15441360-Alexandrium_andersonii.AAC.1